MTYGRGKGVVVNTGMATEVGKIAGMLARAEETETPLKRNLNELGKFLTIAIIVIAVIMFFVGTIFNNTSWVDMLLTSISCGCCDSRRIASDRNDHLSTRHASHGQTKRCYS